MPTWNDYQSVIQLAAGLNFAYASLEVILDRPLLTISSRQQALIDKLRTAAMAGAEPQPGLDATTYVALRDDLDGVTGFHTVICHLNPYVSAACGIATTIMLFYASAHGTRAFSQTDLTVVMSTGFGWFCVVLLTMSALRLFLNLAVEPKLKKLKI